MIWKILAGIYIVGIVCLVWEAISAPTYPDDYDSDPPEDN
jgi:hypothetical protein